MNRQDIASSEKPDVQSLAKRAYVGPRSKHRTLKLKRKKGRQPRPRGRSGY